MTRAPGPRPVARMLLLAAALGSALPATAQDSPVRPAASCRAPLAWRIGTIDPRFGLDPQRIRGAVNLAVVRWQNAVGRDLFVEDSRAGFTVNFLYGERQQATELVGALRSSSTAREAQLEQMRALLDRLVAQYNADVQRHGQRGDAYERRVAQFNEDARRLGSSPGNPAERARLIAEQAALDRERADLLARNGKLDAARDEIERLHAAVQQRINMHNAAVYDANGVLESMPDHLRQLGATHINGPSTRIDLYSYTDLETLDLTLLHELGHALGLAHTRDPNSVMYAERGPATPDRLTEVDVAALRALCGY